MNARRPCLSLYSALFALFLTAFIWCEPSVGQSNRDQFGTIKLRGRRSLLVNSVLNRGGFSFGSNLTVTIACATGVSPEDRDLEVVLYIAPTNSDVPYSVRKKVTLKEGSAQTQIEIPFRASGYQIYWDVGVFEQGVDIEKPRKLGANEFPFQWHNTNNGQNLVGAGIIQGSSENPQALSDMHDALSLIKPIKPQKSNTSNIPGFGGTATLATGYQTFADIHPLKEIPARWGYLHLRPFWMISGATLQECKEKYPETFTAFRNYIASGGKFFVHSMAEDSLIPAVDEMLARSEELPERWKIISHDKDRVQVTQHLLGKVYVLGGTPEEIGEALFHNINLAFDNTTIALAQSNTDGNWFWRNLIEAVGKPPVWSFAAMVALFGAVLGPGLLYLTGRMGRRSLMIFLVPAIAVLATTAIVLYGVLHEGFDSYVRVTSVTWVDTNSKSSFAWSRQNFFSGLPPQEGLELSPNTFAKPTYGKENRNYQFSAPRKGSRYEVEITDKQRWKNWLQPRQQQQLLIGHPVERPALPISVQQTSKGNIEVKNTSKHPIPIVVLRGEGDDYYFGEYLAAGSTRTLKAFDKANVGAKVAKGFRDFRPMAPTEVTQSGDSLLNFGRSSRGSVARIAPSDVMNTAMVHYFSDKLELAPYTFGVIVEENSLIEVPIKGQQSDNLHLMVGEYKW